jgi:hypothetical protein
MPWTDAVHCLRRVQSDIIEPLNELPQALECIRVLSPLVQEIPFNGSLCTSTRNARLLLHIWAQTLDITWLEVVNDGQWDRICQNCALLDESEESYAYG